jgi:zinc protease
MAGARVSEDRLENGLRVLVAERRGDPVVSVVLFYRVGARNEVEREAGVSHFLEHMMFKGSRRFGKGEVDRRTAELGGQNNAFTSYDHTAYWFELASDRWEHALDIEADRMRHLRLDAGEFEAERAVVLEELAMGEDDPWRVLGRTVDAHLFPRHPYGRPIIGTPHSLRGLGVEDMRVYYRRFYHPGNAILVVAGDVSRAAALRAVRARFGRLPRGPALGAVDAYRAPLEEPSGEVRLTTRWDDEGRRLLIGWPTGPVGSREDDAHDLVLIVLASGRTSRLQDRLVHREGLATSVSASNDSRMEGGAFWIYAECAQGVEPAALERALDDELGRLAREPVSRGELARALELLRSMEAFDSETVADLAENLGEWAVDCDWRMAFDGGARHARISRAKLRETVAKRLTRERRVVGWCLPGGRGAGRERRR